MAHEKLSPVREALKRNLAVPKQPLDANWDNAAIDSIIFSTGAIAYIQQELENMVTDFGRKIFLADIKHHERIISGRLEFLRIYNDY